MRVVFMGSPEFAVPCLRALAGAHDVALVVSQPDKPAGRGSQLTAPAVKVAAQELGLPVIQPRSAKTGELRDALVASGAELAVVVAYGKILPRAVLEALPRGCINVHASILPKYRGAAPVQWAVIHGDVETGVAIMQLDEGMDTGPVLLERRVAIDPEETSGELLARLAPIGAAALLEALDRIARGEAEPVAQDHGAATHAPMLAKSDGAIDFTQPARAVAARIRGVDPWPGAQATLRGQTIKLFRARAEGGQGAPGTVLAIDPAGLHVACGEGVAVIRELQAPGRKRLTAMQFAAGRGVAIGDVLGKPELA
ncbi:MAG TPA: methionyl-tRNA formyltransferase [Kofleriaceae bacterium]|nr:methionyl-tRNA formyltransferase [Kofleriaceae bacterium]